MEYSSCNGKLKKYYGLLAQKKVKNETKNREEAPLKTEMTADMHLGLARHPVENS